MATPLLAAALASALAARGVASDAARDAAALLCAGGGSISADAALVALRAADSGPCAWRELFSTRYAGRPYYHNTQTGATTWEARAPGCTHRRASVA